MPSKKMQGRSSNPFSDQQQVDAMRFARGAELARSKIQLKALRKRVETLKKKLHNNKRKLKKAEPDV